MAWKKYAQVRAESGSSFNSAYLNRMVDNVLDHAVNRMPAGGRVYPDADPLVVGSLKPRLLPVYLDVPAEADSVTVHLAYECTGAAVHVRPRYLDPRSARMLDYTPWSSLATGGLAYKKFASIDISNRVSRNWGAVALEVHSRTASATTTNIEVNYGAKNRITPSSDPTATFGELDCVKLDFDDASGVEQGHPQLQKVQSIRMTSDFIYIWPLLPANNILSFTHVDMTLYGSIKIYGIWFEFGGTSGVWRPGANGEVIPFSGTDEERYGLMPGIYPEASVLGKLYAAGSYLFRRSTYLTLSNGVRHTKGSTEHVKLPAFPTVSWYEGMSSAGDYKTLYETACDDALYNDFRLDGSYYEREAAELELVVMVLANASDAEAVALEFRVQTWDEGLLERSYEARVEVFEEFSQCEPAGYEYNVMRYFKTEERVQQPSGVNNLQGLFNKNTWGEHAFRRIKLPVEVANGRIRVQVRLDADWLTALGGAAELEDVSYTIYVVGAQMRFTRSEDWSSLVGNSSVQTEGTSGDFMLPYYFSCVDGRGAGGFSRGADLDEELARVFVDNDMFIRSHVGRRVFLNWASDDDALSPSSSTEVFTFPFSLSDGREDVTLMVEGEHYSADIDVYDDTGSLDVSDTVSNATGLRLTDNVTVTPTVTEGFIRVVLEPNSGTAQVYRLLVYENHIAVADL